MGYWKSGIIIVFAVLSGTLHIAAKGPERGMSAREKRGCVSRNSNERIAADDVKARMHQAKWGYDYIEGTPWFPEDPRYPGAYLFYREGQVDFGFGRYGDMN